MMNFWQPTDFDCRRQAGSRTYNVFDPDMVPIWGVDLDRMTDAIPLLAAQLSEEEKQRSLRFHFERDRRRFVVTRGILRLMLGGYLGGRPSAISFAYNAYGKPSLPGSLLDFNVSHSGNRVLFGFASCLRVGVDIETVRSGLYADAIAKLHFAPREIEVLKLDPGRAVDNFFTFWTCKEAVLKGMGKGITGGLGEIDLSPMVDEVSRSFRFAIAGSGEETWVVTRLNHVSGYAGAVALNGSGKRIVYREFTRESLGCLLQSACVRPPHDRHSVQTAFSPV